jgi:hypothetical protein
MGISIIDRALVLPVGMPLAVVCWSAWPMGVGNRNPDNHE